MKRKISDKDTHKNTYTEMKNEITELIKPIAVHEAKSAVYKAKLAGYVLHKGAKGLQHGAGFISKKAKLAFDNRRKNSKKAIKKGDSD
jgi:hypothetical protein